jgi:hypothetical protein
VSDPNDDDLFQIARGVVRHVKALGLTREDTCALTHLVWREALVAMHRQDGTAWTPLVWGGVKLDLQHPPLPGEPSLFETEVVP